MRTRRVVLDISSSRLELAVLAGRVVVSSHTHPLAADLLDEWPANLVDLLPVLSDLVDRHNLRGLPTTILYTSPDAHAGVFSVPAAISRSAALQAGRLALADAVSFPLHTNAHAIEPLGHTRRATNPAVPIDAHRRLLGIADTDASTSAVYTLAAQAGLRVESLLPEAAALITATIHAAAAQRSTPQDPGTVLLLNLGEHGSVLAAVSAGQTRFVRNFAVGINSFVDALRRPIPSRGTGSGPTNLDRETARRILFAAGVPRREDIVDGPLGIDGAAILPLLQPVLQRCAVEVKQSLRFGLEESERAGVRLRILGLGRVLPRLGESIVELHGAPLTLASAEDQITTVGAAHSATHGATAALLAAGPPPVSLLPRSVESTRRTRAVTRALWAGIAAAALLVTADGVLTHLALRAEAPGTTAAAASAPADDPAFRLYNTAVAARTGVAAALVRLDAALGGATDWSAVLAVLAESTPAEIRLRSIDLLDEPGETPRIRLRAAATPLDGDAPALLIKQYLDTLQSVPLVADARLGATGRALVGGAAVHEFELFCDLVRLPAPRPPTTGAALSAAEPGR